MRRILLAAVLLAGCSKEKGGIPVASDGEKFDEAALVEKGKITILDFSADW